MQLNDTLAAYAKVAGEFGLPEMKAVSVTRHITSGVDYEALKKAVTDFHPTQGWLCFQSAVRYVPSDVQSGAPVLSQFTSDGYLLNAELANSAGESLHVRQTGVRWALTLFTASGVSKESNGGEAFLADTVDFNAANKDLGVVRYQRLWQAQEKIGFAPIAARFLGFGSNHHSQNQSNEAAV